MDRLGDWVYRVNVVIGLLLIDTTNVFCAPSSSSILFHHHRCATHTRLTASANSMIDQFDQLWRTPTPPSTCRFLIIRRYLLPTPITFWDIDSMGVWWSWIYENVSGICRLSVCSNWIRYHLASNIDYSFIPPTTALVRKGQLNSWNYDRKGGNRTESIKHISIIPLFNSRWFRYPLFVIHLRPGRRRRLIKYSAGPEMASAL